jgi:hypothetical protein
MAKMSLTKIAYCILKQGIFSSFLVFQTIFSRLDKSSIIVHISFHLTYPLFTVYFTVITFP